MTDEPAKTALLVPAYDVRSKFTEDALSKDTGAGGLSTIRLSSPTSVRARFALTGGIGRYKLS